MCPTQRRERRVEPARQGILRRLALRQKSRIPALVGEYRRADTRCTRAEERLDEIAETNPDFVFSEARRTARLITVLVGLVAIYILDFVLMSPTVEDLVGRIGVENSALMWTLRATIPLMIMGLEVFLGVLWMNQRDEELDAGEGSRSYMWLALGVLTAAVIPLGVANSVVAEYGAYTGDPTMQKVTLVRGSMLILLAFCGHMTLLLGGRVVEDVRAESLYIGVRARWNREFAAAENRRERSAARVKAMVSAYADTLQQHNEIAARGQALKAGPFSVDDCRTVNEIFGTEFLKVGGRSTPTDVAVDDAEDEPARLAVHETRTRGRGTRSAAARVDAEQEEESDDEGYDDALRAFRERQARDADSIVNP